MTEAAAMNGKPVTGRKVLAWMVAFFGVVIAVNLAFVWFALDTWPGLTTGHAYQEGITYNQTIEQAEKQKALGWRSRLSLGAPTPRGHLVAARMSGPDGQPLRGLAVTALLRRPVGEGLDMTVTLAEDTPGHYAALVKLPAPGRWEVVVTAKGSGATPYRAAREFQTEAAR